MTENKSIVGETEHVFEQGRQGNLPLPLPRDRTGSPHRVCGEEGATASPPPLWGRGRVGGIAEHRRLGLPPPLTPPHKGEGNPSAKVVRAADSIALTYARPRQAPC